MTVLAESTRSTIIPCLRYRDAVKAIDWLREAFGFEAQAVYPNEDGSIAHAQLTLGGGMIMISTASNDSEWGRLIRQPGDVGFETQAACVIVADADAVYASAKAAGAEIVIEIKDEGYGGRGFTCRDLEGHLWNIGTYNPW